MKNKILNISGGAAVLLSILILILTICFREWIHTNESINMKILVIISSLLCLTGTTLGWMSRSTKLGKIVGVAGFFACLIFLLIWVVKP